MSRQHNCHHLVSLFNGLFQHAHRTVLIAGGEEPVYLPAVEAGACHQIIFREDFYASALHEVAHWCIAGRARRQQEDFGYWYLPDGRDKQQQALFAGVEVKPQAMEWMFSAAAGYRFRISSDNLSGASNDFSEIGEQIFQQVMHYKESGLPPRAEQFYRALMQFYDISPHDVTFKLSDMA